MNQFHVTEKWFGQTSLGLAVFVLMGCLIIEPHDAMARERDSRVRDSRGRDRGSHARGKIRSDARKGHRHRDRGYHAELADLYSTLDRIERVNDSRRPSYVKESKIAKIVHRTRQRLYSTPARDSQTRYEFKMALRKIERVNYAGRPGSARQYRISGIIYQTRARLDRMNARHYHARRDYRMTTGRAARLR